MNRCSVLLFAAFFMILSLTGCTGAQLFSTLAGVYCATEIAVEKESYRSAGTPGTITANFPLRKSDSWTYSTGMTIAVLAEQTGNDITALLQDTSGCAMLEVKRNGKVDHLYVAELDDRLLLFRFKQDNGAYDLTLKTPLPMIEFGVPGTSRTLAVEDYIPFIKGMKIHVSYQGKRQELVLPGGNTIGQCSKVVISTETLEDGKKEDYFTVWFRESVGLVAKSQGNAPDTIDLGKGNFYMTGFSNKAGVWEK